MEFDGQSEIPESGIKEAVMSTADHSSDHRTVIYLQRDRGIFEMTAESAGAGHTEQKTRIVKVIKSQGSTHTDIQIPIASLGCPIPPAAAPIIDSRNGQPFKWGVASVNCKNSETKDRIDKEIPRHLPTVIPRRFSLEPKPSRKQTNCKQEPIKSFS